MKTILLALIIFTSGQRLCAQNRFDTGIPIGLNFAELEGLGIMDYYGLNTGVMGKAKLSKNWSLSCEILFSQNGEYVLPKHWPNITYGRIRLNHLEVPFYLSLKIPILQKSVDHSLQLSWGMAYVQLFSHKAFNENNSVDQSTLIVYGQTSNWLYQSAIHYYLNEHFGFGARMSIAPSSNWTLGPTLLLRTCYWVG